MKKKPRVRASVAAGGRKGRMLCSVDAREEVKDVVVLVTLSLVNEYWMVSLELIELTTSQRHHLELRILQMRERVTTTIVLIWALKLPSFSS